MSIPAVRSFVRLDRVNNGISRVKFRIAYDVGSEVIIEPGTTLRRARERLAAILASNKHAAQREGLEVTS